MNRSVPLAIAFATLSLVVVPTSFAVGPLMGDFNADGLLSSLDVNLLTAKIAAGSNDFAYDLNFNGLVDEPDLVLWFPYYSSDSGVPLAVALVDVNFDTLNTITDFQIIQSHISVATTNFTDGNLVPDSLVNAADRALYISRGGTVPEPSTLLLAIAALATLSTRRRRQ